MSDLKNVKDIIANDTVNVKRSSLKSRRSSLLEIANTLPKLSGCYYMKGKDEEILYVGKAKNLKARVASYFNQSVKNPKTEILVGHIYSFDFILTSSEVESLVLENNLIKEHKPKYNIQLKDDKSYPYVAINKQDPFPRILYLRKPKKNKDQDLYGPFPVGSNISKIIRLLTKAFNLRDCSDNEFKARMTPCLLYQMNQCSAPCVGKISEKNYQKDLDQCLNFFRDNKKVKYTMDLLTQKMMKAAELEHFEYAAMMRDTIEELDQFIEKSYDQKVELLDDKNLDVISYFKGESEVDISLYLIREGMLLGFKNFHFLHTDFIEDLESEILLALLQYYQQNEENLPMRIILPLKRSICDSMELALKNIFQQSPKIKVSSGPVKYKKLIQTATNHAKEVQNVRMKNQDSIYVGLHKLQQLLNLKERPKILECYDIAIWQGKSPTASQVVFYEGKADKLRYRYYHMQELPEGNNDFAMMTEVFSRRMKKGNFPDVFIVDGGVQQVNTVIKVLEKFDCDIPVVGIAKARDLKKLGFKDKEVRHSEERLVISGRSNPYILAKCPALLRIMVQMRDEAHRFSRKLHHKTEHKRVIKSWLDEVKGLSDKIKKNIQIKNTMSWDELSTLNLSQLQKILGLELRHARILYKFLHAKKNN